MRIRWFKFFYRKKKINKIYTSLFHCTLKLRINKRLKWQIKNACNHVSMSIIPILSIHPEISSFRYVISTISSFYYFHCNEINEKTFCSFFQIVQTAMVLTSRLRAVPYYLKNLYHRCLSHSPIRFINFCWNYNAMSFNVWWLGHLLDGLFLRYGSPTKNVNSLSADHTKWSNTFKQFVGLKSYVQPDPLSEFLIIANLQQSANLNMRKTWVKTFFHYLKNVVFH